MAKLEVFTSKDSSASWFGKVSLFTLTSFFLAKIRANKSVSESLCRSSFFFYHVGLPKDK